jgi:hypothetical protein
LSFLQIWGGLEAETAPSQITVYRTEFCVCCKEYESYLRSIGISFRTVVVEPEELEAIRRERGVPRDLYSCHTSVVGPYFVEGHVPAEAIKRLLSEMPEIDGISLPGMPAGSPGMGGEKLGPFEIYAVKDGRAFLWIAL